MEIINVFQASSAFNVLKTTWRSQTAVMTLEAGETSSDEPSVHPQSDQVLIVLEGELFAEIAGASVVMREADTLTVPAGMPHRFCNRSSDRAVTFSVYAPPAYPPAGEPRTGAE